MTEGQVWVVIADVFIDPDIGNVVLGVAATEAVARRIAAEAEAGPPPNWVQRDGSLGFEVDWEPYGVER